MFIGHAAVAFAVRPRVPRRSLGVLLAAAYFLDLVWPVLLLLGVEVVRIHPGDTAFTPLTFVQYPWSHSLVAAVIWGGLFGCLLLRCKFRPTTEFLWLFGLVVSHWFLDYFTHRPDLPLIPGSSTVVGLGLWRSVPATLIIEGAIFTVGLAIYLRASEPRDRTGSVALWCLVALLLAIWVSGPFSPPPPNEASIGIVGLFMWLIPVWGHWVDRHRRLKETELGRTAQHQVQPDS